MIDNNEQHTLISARRKSVKEIEGMESPSAILRHTDIQSDKSKPVLENDYHMSPSNRPEMLSELRRRASSTVNLTPTAFLF